MLSCILITLVSDAFLAVAGAITGFMLGVPMIAKLFHVIRAQLRKMLLVINENEDDEVRSESEGSAA